MQRLIILIAIISSHGVSQQVSPQIVNKDYDPVERRIWIQLADDPKEIDGVAVAPGTKIPCPLVYFRASSAERRILFCDVELEGLKINLRNFRLVPDQDSTPADDLQAGAQPSDKLFPPIPAGSNRTYYVQFESVLVDGAVEPVPIRTAIKLGANLSMPPEPLLVIEDENKDELKLFVRGVSIADFIAAFKASPSAIRVRYDFADDDPAIDIDTYASSVEASTTDNSAIIRPDRSPPERPIDYDVIVSVPWQTMRDKTPVQSPDWAYPAKKGSSDDLVATHSISKSIPSAPQRDNSAVAFETAWNSIVKPSIGKRNNVGVFSLYLNPSIPIKFYGTDDNNDNPWWLSLDPLFEADIDTQKIADSESPNRILMGLDLSYGQELGFYKDNGQLKRKGILRRFIWKNGFRYDSDRDFKLQTMYFQTEFSPRFEGFEDDFARRLYRFKNNPKNKGKGKEPFLSSYFLRPFFGYDLGGTINRDNRDLTTPTEHISRGFVRLNGELEVKRLFKMGFDNTYYFLQNAERRRHRNYIETYLEMNVGRLAKFDLAGWSNAVFFKFKAGEQPPDFGRVNSLSLGFKVFR